MRDGGYTHSKDGKTLKCSLPITKPTTSLLLQRARTGTRTNLRTPAPGHLAPSPRLAYRQVTACNTRSSTGQQRLISPIIKPGAKSELEDDPGITDSSNDLENQ